MAVSRQRKIIKKAMELGKLSVEKVKEKIIGPDKQTDTWALMWLVFSSCGHWTDGIIVTKQAMAVCEREPEETFFLWILFFLTGRTRLGAKAWYQFETLTSITLDSGASLSLWSPLNRNMAKYSSRKTCLAYTMDILRIKSTQAPPLTCQNKARDRSVNSNFSISPVRLFHKSSFIDFFLPNSQNYTALVLCPASHANYVTRRFGLVKLLFFKQPRLRNKSNYSSVNPDKSGPQLSLIDRVNVVKTRRSLRVTYISFLVTKISDRRGREL